jgi:hypothetical protein
MAKATPMAITGQGWWMVVAAVAVGALGAFYWAKTLVNNA